MNHSTRRQYSAVLSSCLLCLSFCSIAQDTRTFNQNASRSNHTRLSVSLSPVFSTPVNSNNDSLLFRGNGSGFNIGVDYYFDKIGIGLITGFGSSSADDATINSFLKRAGTVIDLPVIRKSKQQNMYLLVGPSVRVGGKVALEAHAKGGLFINNGGIVNIQQKGAQRAAYRNEPTDKAINPGFLTGVKVKYSSKSNAWSFGVGMDYMGTKTEINNYDARRGAGIEPLKLSKNIKDLVASLTITYNILSPRDHASGQSTGRRMATVDNGITSPRDLASGQSTGRMTTAGPCGPVTQTINYDIIAPRDVASGLPTGRMANVNNGMPNRISMNMTVGKQTQGATFGEKVNAGLHAAGSALAQGASLTNVKPAGVMTGNVIAGKLTWTGENVANGISTNKTIISTQRQTPNTSFGARISIGVREATTAKGAAEKKYGIIFADQGARKDDSGPAVVTSNPLYTNVSISNNPLYDGNGGSGLNPLFESKMSGIQNNPLYTDKGSSTNPLAGQKAVDGRADGRDQDCDGFAEINISLVDPVTGAIVANTRTERCGDFFFANVPDGEYIVKVTGAVTFTKGYDIHTSSSIDLAGVASQAPQQVRLQLYTQIINDNTQQQEILSGSKTLQYYNEDANGDNIQEIHVGSVVTPRKNGSKDPIDAPTTQPVALAEGNPIGGIIVKGGKNPGGAMRVTNTNEKGEFIFKDIEAGDYTFQLDQTILINDESVVEVSPASARTGPRTYTGGRKNESVNLSVTENPLYENDNSSRDNPLYNASSRASSTDKRTYTGGRKIENISTTTSSTEVAAAGKLKGKVIRSSDKGMMQIVAGEPITFTWNNVQAKQGDEVIYRLRVWQFVNGQTGNEAMLRNVPILEKQIKGSTEFTLSAMEIGPCKPPYLCDFIWAVEAVGQPGDKYETHADATMFRITKGKQNQAAPKKEKSSGLKDTLKTQV